MSLNCIFLKTISSCRFWWMYRKICEFVKQKFWIFTTKYANLLNFNHTWNKKGQLRINKRQMRTKCALILKTTSDNRKKFFWGKKWELDTINFISKMRTNCDNEIKTKLSVCCDNYVLILKIREGWPEMRETHRYWSSSKRIFLEPNFDKNLRAGPE